MPSVESFRTIIIGGGQAGLAAAYYLTQAKDDFVVLDADTEIGAAWRQRWDSLRLFTPSKFNGLPGMPYPAADFYFPTKDEVVAYLRQYVEKFQIPIRLNTKVESLTRSGGRFTITAGDRSFSSENVIVATGAYQVPFVPSFSRELSTAITQLHSSSYQNPQQVPHGDILVVGAGNSGAEIAIELARAGRKVWLAGRSVGRIPSNELGRLFGGKPYWTFISRVLSIDTPIGRKVRQKALHQGTPLIRLKPKDIEDAGVTRCGRVRGAHAGKPELEDGKTLDVAAVIWSTGYRPDYQWIRLPVFDEQGYPLHSRGVVAQEPGLYFVGLHFQTALTSALLGGVGADARFVTSRVTLREAREPVPSPIAPALD